ncbi:MAG: hypothetical protein AAF571_03515 [Verrucomicrobiota bacterium]
MLSLLPLQAKTGDTSDLPRDVREIVEEDGDLIFEDDFDRKDDDEEDDLGDDWKTNSKARAQGDKQNDLVEGELVMTISPKADHAISTGHDLEEPVKDMVVYLRMKLPEGGSLKLAFNDKKDKSVWAGHINGVTINHRNIKIDDERTGRFNMNYRNNRNSPEAKEAFSKSAKNFPIKLREDKWYEVVTHHQGDTLTVYIDGDEEASFTSPGFAHETKRHFVFAVPKIAIVDDLMIWAIED